MTLITEVRQNVKGLGINSWHHLPVEDASGLPLNMFSEAAAGAVSRASIDTDVPVVLKADTDQHHQSMNTRVCAHTHTGQGGGEGEGEGGSGKAILNIPSLWWCPVKPSPGEGGQWQSKTEHPKLMMVSCQTKSGGGGSVAKQDWTSQAYDGVPSN